MSKIFLDLCKKEKIRQSPICEVDGCWGLEVTLKSKETLSEKIMFELRSE